MKISASIYSDAARPLQAVIADLVAHQVDLLHIDCNDNLSVFDDIKLIRSICSVPLDLHIITSEPEKFYPFLIENPVDYVTFQLEDLQGEATDIIVCGHSLGGAVATLYAYSIKKHYPHYHIKSTTIGSPRVGNKVFKENYDKSEIDTLRIVHNNDLVTHTPYIRFYHVNYQVRLDNNGNKLKRDTSLSALWLYLKSLFSGKNIKDHMGDGYLKALENWAK